MNEGRFQQTVVQLKPFFGDEPSTRFDRQIDSIGTQPVGGGGSGGYDLPFRIVDVSPDASTPEIKVTYGTVMDILPTDVDVTLTCAATETFYLDATIDAAGVVTAVDLLQGTLPADSTYHAFLLVGTVTVTGTAITAIAQSLYFSQGFKACDRDPADPATTPGTYEFFVR